MLGLRFLITWKISYVSSGIQNSKFSNVGFVAFILIPKGRKIMNTNFWLYIYTYIWIRFSKSKISYIQNDQC